MTSIPAGYALIPGRGVENARRVLAAAVEAGLDAYAVRTTDEGYIAPTAVLAAYEAVTINEEPEDGSVPAQRKTRSSKKKES